jgi:hypothetical protein
MTSKAMMTKMLTILAVGAGIGLAPACAKKGSGKGTRAQRPDVADSGSIMNDGNGNQNPVPKDETPPAMPKTDPDALALLSTCFKLDPTEIVYVTGWEDPVMARDGALALCAKLDKTHYKDGVSLTSTPVDVD